MRSLRHLRRSAVLPPLVLTLWGWVLVWSSLSSRLDLLLNAAFHPVVVIAGVVLMLLGLLQLRLLGRRRAGVAPLVWLLSAGVALLILVMPPEPSFSDLAASRPDSLPAAPSLSFFLPPEQRTLTEWVRLLRSQPDPELHAGDPVRISGFVLDRPGEPLQLARLTVRCCLADATPAGLPVDWPEEANPQPDQWFSIEGTMIVQERNGVPVSVVKPNRMTLIPRPDRPLEP
ncbi:TIGR03943 family putative permease subunit [Synechococcus sp. MIT S9507]|uniref:TIGR03943 family putative permease subunit n=1 Tax=Synechococcus sp. MIT S9507 TaxID=3082544 RepID=UPI0039B65712